MPLAHDDVVGVEHFQSAMQYLEDGLGIFLIVRGARIKSAPIASASVSRPLSK
jgi:hypothetical protein